MVMFFDIYLFKFVVVNVYQGVCWVYFYVGWIVFVVEVEIVFVGFGFFCYDVQFGVVMVDYWVYYYFYCFVWVGDDVGFVVDVMFLYYMDKVFIMVDGVVWVDVGVGGVFILMVGGCCGNIDFFDYVNMWLKGVRCQGGVVLMFLMGYYVGYFVSVIVDIFVCIGDNEMVYLFFQQ